jgi:hypothetical protein
VVVTMGLRYAMSLPVAVTVSGIESLSEESISAPVRGPRSRLDQCTSGAYSNRSPAATSSKPLFASRDDNAQSPRR